MVTELVSSDSVTINVEHLGSRVALRFRAPGSEDGLYVMRPSTARAMAHELAKKAGDCAADAVVKVRLGRDTFFELERSQALAVAGDLQRHADHFPTEVPS